MILLIADGNLYRLQTRAGKLGYHMKASSFFGGQYLSVDDLNGQVTEVTITSIGTEMLTDRDGNERERIVFYCDGVKKPIILNATNGDRLISAWGDETDDWIGCKIMLVKGKIMFAGKRIDSVVINPVVKATK